MRPTRRTIRSRGILAVAIEPPDGDDVRAARRAIGHQIVDERPVSFGGEKATLRIRERYSGGSDPRKDGMAIGY